MCFLASTLIIWVPLLNNINGIVYAETVFEKVLFGQEKLLEPIEVSTGNFWSLFGFEMKASVIQLTILFYCNLSTIFKIASLNKRRLIHSILTLYLMTLCLGKTTHNPLLMQTAIALFIGLLYNQF